MAGWAGVDVEHANECHKDMMICCMRLKSTKSKGVFPPDNEVAFKHVSCKPWFACSRSVLDADKIPKFPKVPHS